MLTVVEKVLFLQRIDVLAEVPSHGLAHVAMIAKEESYPPGTVLFVEGDPAEALYFVIEGNVELSRQGRNVETASRYDAFGTWALFDDEALVVTATTASPVSALKIEREEFLDLLPDHAEIANGVLRTLARRIRSLLQVDRALEPDAGKPPAENT